MHLKGPMRVSMDERAEMLVALRYILGTLVVPVSLFILGGLLIKAEHFKKGACSY